jgi:hypothetical protein
MPPLPNVNYAVPNPNPDTTHCQRSGTRHLPPHSSSFPPEADKYNEDEELRRVDACCGKKKSGKGFLLGTYVFFLNFALYKNQRPLDCFLENNIKKNKKAH